MVEVKFWKMHGLGNDYVIFDNRNERIGADEASRLAQRLCRRRFSVGADGLLLLSNSTVSDVKMRIFNADGSEAEMCGNGLRCLVKYCYENNVTQKKELEVETLAGVKKVWPVIRGDEVKSVRVDMGKPNLDREAIPMLGQGTCIGESLEIEGQKFEMTCLSVGNPHCVIFVDYLENFPVQNVGPKVENLKLFPKKINVEFVQALKKGDLNIRVWERGCGETYACGTGACASVVAGNMLRKVSNKVTTHLLGGDLLVEYSGNLFMTGPAEKVFEGKLL